MTDAPPIICTLSAEALRGYAFGMRDALTIASRATAFNLGSMLTQIRSLSEIADGFADRLEEAGTSDPAKAEPPTPERPLYRPTGWDEAGGFEDARDALADLDLPLLTPAPLTSNQWPGERWAALTPTAEGDTGIEWFASAAEAAAFCDAARAAAQDALTAAAPEPAETRAPNAPPRIRPPKSGPRSIIDLTEAEALDLKRRYEAGAQSVQAIADAFRIPATSIYSRAKGQNWQRGAGPTAATTPIIPKPIDEKSAPLPAIPMSAEDKAEARERLRTGDSKGARDIIEWFGCTPEEAQRLVDDWRAKNGKGA